MNELETKTYPDGTQAAGTAPLPDASPMARDGTLADPEKFGCVTFDTAIGTAPPPDASPVSHLQAAVTIVCEALRNDPDYAWGWHCNIAMAAIDSGCPRDVAQEGAALFLQILAQVDMRKHPYFAEAKATTSRDHLEAAALHITTANALTAQTDDFALGKACDLSGEGDCEACQ